jgi:hypothetical protein
LGEIMLGPKAGLLVSDLAQDLFGQIGIGWLVAAVLLCAGAIFVAISAFGQADRRKLPRNSINLRFALLVVTGVALSIASGWTTWDGMRNFTSGPVLSLLITFGIQAILLIVSWLIGETFANQPHGADGNAARDLRGRWWSFGDGIFSGLIAFIFGLLALLMILPYAAPLDAFTSERATAMRHSAIVTLSLAIAGLAILPIATVIASRIATTLRMIAQHAVLWVMLVACMAASVFFSYDSLFSQIFPSDERMRAAEIRTRSQVANLIKTLDDRTSGALITEQKMLSESVAWRTYSQQLSALEEISQRAPELQRSAIASGLRVNQDKIGKLEAEYAGAKLLLDRLTASVRDVETKLKTVRSEAATVTTQAKQLSQKTVAVERQIREQALEAEKEELGLGATGIQGRGPRYRELQRQQRQLELTAKDLKSQASAAAMRLASLDDRLGDFEQRLSRLTGRRSEQRTSTETIETLLRLERQGSGGASTTTLSQIDFVTLARRLKEGREAFIAAPTASHLDGLGKTCSELAATLATFQPLRASVARIDCASMDVFAAASISFQLAGGLAAIRPACSDGDALAGLTGTDALLGFARKCISLARLRAEETDLLYSKINAFSLNRDDKAHRFVVTMNAFKDGNNLAFLALVIALGIDGLVFASGLFGAHSARSPLSDIPQETERSGRQLEDIVLSALLPNPPQVATLALEHMYPIGARSMLGSRHDWTHEINLDKERETSPVSLSKLLSAAAAIGAAQAASDLTNAYFVRKELIEYLARFASLMPAGAKDVDAPWPLEVALADALKPNVPVNATNVLRYVYPRHNADGFSSMVSLSDVAHHHQDLIRKALNVTSVFGLTRPSDGDDHRTKYDLHKDAFQALLRLSRPDEEGAEVTAAPRQLELLDFAQARDRRLPARPS